MSRATVVTETLRSMGRICIDHEPDVFRSILDRIGDKWSLLLIGLLECGPMRFTELLRTTPGISRRMLTITLRALERDGLETSVRLLSETDVSTSSDHDAATTNAGCDV